ncbi:hypothetical protein FJZ31_14870 [Candidatus Poribacteria bacterium]|nr:hypothetical protein [Candidatus Poribacteria bacterium]
MSLKPNLTEIFPRDCNWWTAFIVVGVRYDETKEGITFVDFGVYTSGNGPDKDGIASAIFINGNGQTIHNENFKTEVGKWHTLRFVVNGNSYEAFIDDEQICEFQTNLPDRGGAGLAAGNCEAHFDNVVITGDDIPDRNLSVEPKAKLTTTWGQIKNH